MSGMPPMMVVVFVYIQKKSKKYCFAGRRFGWNLLAGKKNLKKTTNF